MSNRKEMENKLLALKKDQYRDINASYGWYHISYNKISFVKIYKHNGETYSAIWCPDGKNKKLSWVEFYNMYTINLCSINRMFLMLRLGLWDRYIYWDIHV